MYIIVIPYYEFLYFHTVLVVIFHINIMNIMYHKQTFEILELREIHAENLN